MTASPLSGEGAPAPSLEPTESRPPRWAIWLPAGLTTALLLVIAMAFYTLGNRIDTNRDVLALLLEPAGRRLVRFQLLFEAELTVLRSYAAHPRPELMDQFREVVRARDQALAALDELAQRVNEPLSQEVDTLRRFVERREPATLALASGDLSVEAFRRRLPQQDSMARQVNDQAARLDALIADERQLRLSRMRGLERTRLSILAGLFPLALISAALTAWFGERARSLNQRLTRNAAEEALLRDAMAALTHNVELPEALQRIASIAQRVAGADAAYIEQCDDARTRVSVVASTGDRAPPVGLEDTYLGSVTDEVVRAGISVHVPNLARHGQTLGRTIHERCGDCPGLAVPLHHDGDMDGVLILMRSERALSTADLVPRIWILGALAALALRRTRLASALEEERNRLRTIMTELPAGVILAEAPGGRVTLVNRHLIEIWRGQIRSADHIEEYGDWRFFHLDGREYQPEELPLARSIRSGEVVPSEEAEIERFDRSRGMVRMSSAPLRNQRGQITAAVATIYDISEQKRREQANQFLDQVSRALASSLEYEATLRALLQLCVPKLADFAVLYLRTDQDRAIRRFESTPQDDRTREVLQSIDRGYEVPLASPHPSAVAIRTGVSQLRTHITDDLLDLIAQDDEHLELLRQLEMKSAMAVPLIVRGKTLGAILLVSQDAQRRYHQDDLELAEALARRAAIAVDNAELFHTVSQAEKRSRFLADAAETFAASLDYEETIRRIVRLAVPFFADFTVAFLTDDEGNTRQVAVAHRDPEREAVLEKVGALYRPTPKNLASTVMRAVRTGQPVLVEHVTTEFVDSLHFPPEVRAIFDQLAPVSWITIPLIARDVPLGAIVFLFAESGRHYSQADISLGQLLASRAALAMKNARLYGAVHEALRTRDEVLAIVSHDLRNPLHTINMTAELLLNTSTDESRRRHHLEVIAASGARMKRLIQDLLDVARIEAGKTLAIEPKHEPAQRIIHDACEAFAPQAREKGVQLEPVTPDQLPTIFVDHDRIMQVLSNLISNALRFTPEAGRIVVSVTPDQDELRFAVADSGPGIRPEDREKIFLPFWQSTRTGRTGAGLGLTIARAIIEQHGGRIWVENLEGAGAAFCFTLPIANEEGARAAD